MVRARHRVILGQAWVDDRRTISNRARQRDNPGTRAIIQTRCEQSPNGVVPNSAPCQIMHPLVLVGLGVGVGEGLGLGVVLGLDNQVAISRRGCIIWQGCRFRHNNGKAKG